MKYLYEAVPVCRDGFFFIYMSVQILKISCKWLIFAENAGISTGLSGIYGKVSVAVA